MRHLKKFLEETYLDDLKKQKQEAERQSGIKAAEVEKRRKEATGKELSKLQSEYKKKKSSEERESERIEIMQVVSDALLQANLKKPGFEDFETDIKMFLSNYPLEKLPKYGVHNIFRK